MDDRIAVALRYDEGLPAPFVSAVGRGERAARLLEIARRFGVPVETAPELADKLVQIEPAMAIPEELYRPVAEIFAFIMQIDENVRHERTDER